MKKPDLFQRLDPEIKAQVKIMLDQPELPLNDLPAARIAASKRDAAMRAHLPLICGVDKVDSSIPGSSGSPDITVRIYRPQKVSGLLPALLWIHGGGYMLGNIDADDLLCDQFALEGQCLVVSVEYRLAPEHPYPAPLEDCYTALKWLAGSVHELGVDLSRLAIGGASAGGGLAAALALLARDRAEVALKFQLLVYPMIDDCNITPASDTLPETLLWKRLANRIGWRSYLGCEPGSPGISCYASVSRASNLAGLPPAYIAVGDIDLFAVENIEYAARLVKAGVPTELHVYPGVCHGFNVLAPASDVAKRFTKDMQRALQRELHT